MRVDVLTIFPDMFDGPMSASIIGQAREKGALEMHLHDLRDWTHDRHRTTDDEPYGGGPGMVMKPEPICEALDDILEIDPREAVTVFLTPAGLPFTQQTAHELADVHRFILVCGRYEGFDERALGRADIELSIGDYVLTGGELPAMVIIDAVTRLLPGVLGDDQSSVEESFAEGLLEYPQYTRPAEYRGQVVPDVLRSGDHARIAAWRRMEAVRKTARVRPDMLDSATLTREERAVAADEQDAR